MNKTHTEQARCYRAQPVSLADEVAHPAFISSKQDLEELQARIAAGNGRGVTRPRGKFIVEIICL